MAWRMIGLPARFAYCFGTSDPKREPRPAATMRAAIVGMTKDRLSCEWSLTKDSQ